MKSYEYLNNFETAEGVLSVIREDEKGLCLKISDQKGQTRTFRYFCSAQESISITCHAGQRARLTPEKKIELIREEPQYTIRFKMIEISSRTPLSLSPVTVPFSGKLKKAGNLNEDGRIFLLVGRNGVEKEFLIEEMPLFTAQIEEAIGKEVTIGPKGIVIN